MIPTLSFCITCNKNIEYIKNTLMYNLYNNKLYQKNIEFIVVNFNRNQSLDTWLIENFEKELNMGYLKYIQAKELINWHESITKNIAATYAANDILVNIDSGFLLEFECTSYIIKTFINNKNGVIHINTLQEKGHLGHLAVSRIFFDLLGGYDESFAPIGYQTIDLLNRLRYLGLNYSRYKQNKDYSLKSTLLTCGYTFAEYNVMLNNNFITSKKNISQGNLIVNKDAHHKS